MDKLQELIQITNNQYSITIEINKHKDYHESVLDNLLSIYEKKEAIPIEETILEKMIEKDFMVELNIFEYDGLLSTTYDYNLEEAIIKTIEKFKK